jgi:acetyltransferase-like isoleucine patch superfamily enzyme
VPIREQERVSAGIRVGRDAWIGAGVRVLDGVTIGDGAVIGANAVVREAVPDRAVAVGVPARVVSTRAAT